MPREPTTRWYAAKDARDCWNAGLLATLFSSLSFAQKLSLQMGIGNVAGDSLRGALFQKKLISRMAPSVYQSKEQLN
jgi:hypothetical protein